MIETNRLVETLLNVRRSLTLVACLFVLPATPGDARSQTGDATPVVFARGGKFNMLYDNRQRPQSVLLHGRLFVVYNGDAEPTKNGKGRARPMVISYGVRDRTWTRPVRLSDDPDDDHHYAPIIWAGRDDRLHVLFGCHKTPGTHLVSTRPIRDGDPEVAWEEAPRIAPKLSYPTVFWISGGRTLIYYRTDGHTSSWTYRISRDDGRTWTGPRKDVTDLDAKARLDWSSYHTKIPGRDGKHLHVAYTDYDDNKHKPDDRRLFNPRYNRVVSNEWKYNLSYVKIDLETHDVCNADGEVLKTPIDIDYSKKHCQIWDTEGRGAGIPPAIALDADGHPAFLHVLSEDTLTEHRYYYVRRAGGGWKRTPVTRSNHQWNSCSLARKADGTLRACLVTGEGYLETGEYMDKHGGGRIEEWISKDAGDTWRKRRDISPGPPMYAGWRFNNVQHVVRPDGSAVGGMLLFYGWKDGNVPDAHAFLLDETGR